MQKRHRFAGIGRTTTKLLSFFPVSTSSVLVQDLRNYKLLSGTFSFLVEVFPSQSIQRFCGTLSRTIAEFLQGVLPDPSSPLG